MTNSSESGQRKSSVIAFVIFIALTLGFAFFGMKACVEYRGSKGVRLVLDHDGSRYLHSVFAKLSDAPSLLATRFTIYTDGSDVFVGVTDAERILAIAANEVLRVPKKEVAYDGYFVERSDHGYRSKNVVQPMKDGVQEVTYTITGETPKGRPWTLQYASSMENGMRAIENCEERSFFEVFNVTPGETTMNLVDNIVVSVATLEDLTGASFEFDREGGLLIIRPITSSSDG